MIVLVGVRANLCIVDKGLWVGCGRYPADEEWIELAANILARSSFAEHLQIEGNVDARIDLQRRVTS